MPDHHAIRHPHEHLADLSDNNRQGEGQRGPGFLEVGAHQTPDREDGRNRKHDENLPPVDSLRRPHAHRKIRRPHIAGNKARDHGVVAFQREPMPVRLIG